MFAILIQADILDDFPSEIDSRKKLREGIMYRSNRSLNNPSRAYPGHLTSFPAREGENVINLVFPGADIWSLLIGGGEFDR